ncbi:SDR family oxidoreductase [Phycisphaerales bacterium AB-hyl4]|uniref:SDR family oxidoreductase n=1 Tax=Natronomicrosphaera hydrolytica TaxID=3242702 RepID=A0ABV4UAY6_9BACT
MNRLKDQVIFVTGATGGIGGAVARQLAEAGAKLAISGRDKAKLDALCKDLGGDVFVAPADVTDEAAVSAALAAARQHFGRLDTLVNVPGMSVPAKLAEMNVDDFQRTFDVNVKGMFLCSKHFLAHTDKARGGLIVSISSVAGKSANPNAPAYCAAKAAMNMLSNGFALQTKEANVRVTLVSPGAVSTPGFWGDRPVPHDKFLQPEDVAEVVSFVVGLPEHIVMHDVVFEPWYFFRSK